MSDTVEDLQKARWYIDREIARMSVRTNSSAEPIVLASDAQVANIRRSLAGEPRVWEKMADVPDNVVVMDSAECEFIKSAGRARFNDADPGEWWAETEDYVDYAPFTEVL